MKKVLLMIMIIIFIGFLNACEMFGGKSGVDKKYYDNCAVFTFDNLKVKYLYSCLEVA